MKKLIAMALVSVLISSSSFAERTQYTVPCSRLDVLHVFCKADACKEAKMNASQDCLRAGYKDLDVKEKNTHTFRERSRTYATCDVVYGCKCKN